MGDYDKTLTVLKDGKVTDLTPKELQRIQEYKDSGLPGIASVTDVGVTKALDLYLGGKTYHEIAKILNIKKDILLYLAQKFKWYETKMEQLEILDANLKERILHAKLVNQDFVLQIQQFYLQKIGRKINRYLATGDEEIAAKIDSKDIDRYQKAVELMDKLTTEKTLNPRGPAIGLNLGDGGVDIRRVGENDITITPRNKTVGEMLNELANTKRKEEAGPKKDSYDIVLEESKNTETEETEGNKDEEEN
jgi:hypothetical protein